MKKTTYILIWIGCIALSIIGYLVSGYTHSEGVFDIEREYVYLVRNAYIIFNLFAGITLLRMYSDNQKK